MRIPLLLFCATVILLGCSRTTSQEALTNRWSDFRLSPVLEAQEHRDTKELCTLLKDPEVVVREAAALAFASTQDTASIPCLLNALRDRSAVVRANAVFALGFVADSTIIDAMAEFGKNEAVDEVKKACFSATLVAMQRNNMLNDPQVLKNVFDRSNDHDRIRLADAFRRLPDSSMVAFGPSILELIAHEKNDEVKAALIRGTKALTSSESKELLLRSIVPDQPVFVRVNALRVLAAKYENDAVPQLLEALNDKDHSIRTSAVEALTNLPEPVDPRILRNANVDLEDPMTWIPVHGLLLRSANNEDEVKAFRGNGENNNAYTRSLMLKARAFTQRTILDSALFIILENDTSALMRQSAFESLVFRAREMMKRSRYATSEAQYAQLGKVIRRTMVTGDPGLLAAAAEELNKESAGPIAIMFDKEIEQRALSGLRPIQDLEARLLLEQVAAKRDGSPSAKASPPPFNRMIDPIKLRALAQGQQYRITTSKGAIIIATDVNDCPGSSLAFDSLVTTGYYNGKSFHRMVPNFVVQGGCPRGDGYGGMPWTLRTEIGRKPFTAGSVGLASAGRDTESCQFFITHSATPHLDGRYTRFGEVVSGMDVVMKLQVGDVMLGVEKMGHE